jgi:type II secretory pathway pseudopilin PulG
MLTSATARRSRAGFTTAELLIVLGILAILLAVGLPRMTAWVRGNRVGGAYNEVSSDISLARLRAMRAGQQASFTITSSTTYSIMVNGAAVKTVSLARSYPGVTMSPAAGSVVFNSRGLKTGNAEFSLTLSSSAGARGMTVNQLGRVMRDY